MFTKIMVPVDLAHAATVEKAIQIAADLARLHNAEIFLVGVTDTAPGSVAHDPAEYQQKLEQFAADHSSRHGCSMAAKVVICNDPAAELDEALEDGRASWEPAEYPEVDSSDIERFLEERIAAQMEEEQFDQMRDDRAEAESDSK